jgi:hypothetical protein
MLKPDTTLGCAGGSTGASFSRATRCPEAEALVERGAM